VIDVAIYGVLWLVETVLGWFGWETNLIHRDEAKADGRNWTPPR
jgi:hypothetical protein